MSVSREIETHGDETNAYVATEKNEPDAIATLLEDVVTPTDDTLPKNLTTRIRKGLPKEVPTEISDGVTSRVLRISIAAATQSMERVRKVAEMLEEKPDTITPNFLTSTPDNEVREAVAERISELSIKGFLEGLKGKGLDSQRANHVIVEAGLLARITTHRLIENGSVDDNPLVYKARVKRVKANPSSRRTGRLIDPKTGMTHVS